MHRIDHMHCPVILLTGSFIEVLCGKGGCTCSLFLAAFSWLLSVSKTRSRLSRSSAILRRFSDCPACFACLAFFALQNCLNQSVLL